MPPQSNDQREGVNSRSVKEKRYGLYCWVEWKSSRDIQKLKVFQTTWQAGTGKLSDDIQL
jgi:hypothetical protein